MAKDLTYRYFYLKNYRDETFDITGSFGYLPFLQNPSGLGASYAITSSQVETKLVVSSRIINLDTITGTLLFKTYDQYNTFVKWIRSSQINNNILKLYYKTTNEEKNYYYEVLLQNIQKTEKDKTGFLSCGITFQKLSVQLNDQTISVNNIINPETTHLGYVYPVGVGGALYKNYGLGAISGTNLKVVINSLNTNVVACRITINGSFTNPTWISNNTNPYSATNEKMSGAYSVSGGGNLIIDSNYRNPKIEHNGLDVSDKSEKSRSELLYLIQGYNEIIFDTTSTAETTITIEYQEERDS
jgi:hypothetical protein